MSDWPERWVAATGSNVFEMVTSGSRGWAKHYAESGAAFIRVGNLDHDTIQLDLCNIQRVAPPSGAEGERTRLQAHDLLVSITAEVGMVALVPDGLGEAYINQHIALARPLPGFDPRFIAWYLASEADGKRRLREVSRGGTKSGLGLDDIRNVSIPLAPLAEQQRIADKLDTVLARVDVCRDRLARVAPLLKRFRQSVLAAATSGWLTSTARGGYSAVALSLLLEEPLRNGKSVVDGAGVRVLRLSSLGEKEVKLAESKRGDWSGIEVDRYLMHAGDFLVARGNGSRELVGRGALVGKEPPEPVAFPDTMIRVRPKLTMLNPHYLRAIWDGGEVRGQIEASARTTAGIYKISQADLDSLEIPLPPLEEQAEIVRRVETLFAFADRLEARLAQAQTAVDRLTPSLLAKAFRGELVPQDPADEPAAELLKRLAAQRQAEPARPRRKRATA